MNATITDLAELRRRDLGKIRRASFWEHRADAAPTVAAKASVAWDALRARIKRLPADEQDIAWRHIVAALNSIAPDVGAPRIRVTEEAS